MDPIIFAYWSFGIAGFLFVLLVLVVFFVGAPLFAFIKAKLTGRTILLLGRKDRRLEYVCGKYEGGIIRTKKFGDYIVIPQTTYQGSNGVMVGLAFEPYGTTLSREFIEACESLRDAGIESYKELEDKMPEFLKTAEKISRLEGDFIVLTPEMMKGRSPSEIETLKKQIDELNNERAVRQLTSIGRYTKAFHNITSFFKYNVNPHNIRVTINRSVHEALEQYHKTDWMKFVMVFMAIAVIGALIYIMITRSGGTENIGKVITQYVPINISGTSVR